MPRRVFVFYPRWRAADAELEAAGLADMIRDPGDSAGASYRPRISRGIKHCMLNLAARRPKPAGNRRRPRHWWFAPAVLGLWALPAAAAELSPEDAAKHVGETATVCGVVASARFVSGSRSQPTLLNLGKPYPDRVFTATIFGDDRAKFGAPEKALLGKRICVTGKIKDFRGVPEIILSDPKQLTQ